MNQTSIGHLMFPGTRVIDGQAPLLYSYCVAPTGEQPAMPSPLHHGGLLRRKQKFQLTAMAK
jgi:hypothetical protein